MPSAYLGVDGTAGAPLGQRRVRIGSLLRSALVGVGALSIAAVTWLSLALPFYFDRPLVRADRPSKADAIVCITGGLSGNQLPLDVGWQRIYTAVQLYHDGYAPNVIFSGAGTEATSEAEIYAEAARWLGCPAEAIRIDAGPTSTAEHPPSLLRRTELGIRADTPLLIVTSRLHSRRTAMAFEKHGFNNFRMITSYVSRRGDASVARHKRASSVEGFEPSGKSYADPINTLRWRLDEFFVAVRELVAIAWYKWKGYV